jgi:hypothetical protein
MTGKRSKALCHVTWMYLALSATVYSQADLRHPLAPGTYRFAGKCIEFRDSVSDMIQYCGNQLTIVARREGMPAFLFITTDGKAWMFPAERLKKASDYGSSALFTISSITDL